MQARQARRALSFMRRPLVVVFLLALVASGCGDAIRPVAAATVNGRDITQDALQEELVAIQNNTEYVQAIEQAGRKVLGTGPNTLDSQFVAALLTRQIYFELVHQELLRRNRDVTPVEVEAARDDAVQSVGDEDVFLRFPQRYQQTLLRRSAQLNKLLAELSDGEVDAAAIKKYYDDNADQFSQTCVSHILFAATDAEGNLDQQATAAQADALRAQAQAVRTQIASGADFAALAKQHSQDTGSRDDDGDLGCGPAGRFVPEFEAAMDSLAEGEISTPVQTQFGWHLIKVTARQVQSLKEAEPQIRRRLQSQRDEGIGEFLQQAIERANVSVNPRYGRFDKGEGRQGPGVVPPDAPTTTEAGGAGNRGGPPSFPEP